MRLFNAYTNIARDLPLPKSDTIRLAIENGILRAKANPGEGMTKKEILLAIHAADYFYSMGGGNDLLKEAEAILERKTQDYNSGYKDDPNFKLDDARIQYFPFGHASYLHMLLTKIQRIESIEAKGGQHHFEGTLDSYIDIANYLSFYYSYLLDYN